jgi:hypothetical protein
MAGLLEIDFNERSFYLSGRKTPSSLGRKTSWKKIDQTGHFGQAKWAEKQTTV